jgi:uncharacterized membrane protein
MNFRLLVSSASRHVIELHVTAFDLIVVTFSLVTVIVANTAANVFQRVNYRSTTLYLAAGVDSQAGRILCVRAYDAMSEKEAKHLKRLTCP